MPETSLPMHFPFDDTWRADIAARCAAFPRVAYGGSDALKHAAVAIVLTHAGDGSGEATILLTKRAMSLRGHAGQWALPGGRCDEGETLQQAALRELHEELGLEAGDADILGVLDDYPTRSGYAIAPVVVWLADDTALAPNPAEVASVHRIRLGSLAHDTAIEFLTIPESDRQVIRLHFGDRHIHAPTAALVYQFRELALGRVTRVVDLDAPVFAWR